MEQINLFEEDERAIRKAQQIKQVREDYRLWKKVPEKSPFEPWMLKYVDSGGVFGNVEHKCEQMTGENEYCWQNRAECIAGGSPFWVYHPGKMKGEFVDKCPCCGADLTKYEGGIYVTKWQRGKTYYQEKSVREYYELDEVDEEVA